MPSSYRLLLIAAGILALCIIGSIAVINWSLQPSNRADSAPQLLRIEEGASVASIATDLAQRDLIRSPVAFKALARLRGATAKIGLYHVSAADTPAAILTLIVSGEVSETTITILEGWRAEEVAARLFEAELIASPADFLAAIVVSESTPTDIVERFKLTHGDSLEGFLFPDTYRFATSKDPAAIVAKLLNTFQRRTTDLDLSYEDLILGSIVEREALFDEDRAEVAGVYANRLGIGMKLDADPTVQYAKATNEFKSRCHSERLEPTSGDPRVEESSSSGDCLEFDYWPKLVIRDYDLVESSYNTYRNPGLPPTPISNPGLASLKAAVAPAEHDFLYFLHDADGRTHFARSIEEHTRNKIEFLR